MEGALKAGDVVVVPFPFSNLAEAKRRPALVVATLKGNDVVLCQITSKAVKDDYAVVLEEDDFEEGSLRQKSNIRPNRIFTADKGIVLYKVGYLKEAKLKEVVNRICEILGQKPPEPL